MCFDCVPILGAHFADHTTQLQQSQSRLRCPSGSSGHGLPERDLLLHLRLSSKPSRREAGNSRERYLQPEGAPRSYVYIYIYIYVAVVVKAVLDPVLVGK